jgi:hypothetical protein
MTGQASRNKQTSFNVSFWEWKKSLAFRRSLQQSSYGGGDSDGALAKFTSNISTRAAGETGLRIKGVVGH